MNTGYHLTHAKNLDSIMAQGLRKDADGWDAGYVWFWDDLEVAYAMLPKWAMNERPVVVLKIDLAGLNVQRDPHRAGNGPAYAAHAYAYPGTIEPRRLSEETR